MAGLPALFLLLVCFEFGFGLHWQVVRRAKNPLSRDNVFARQKREWIIPPVSIYEEQDNSKKNPIAKIQSDQILTMNRITYRVTGRGVTEPPYGLFIINEKTGEMNVTGIVDREEISMFYLKGYALNQDGSDVEPPIELRVKVVDINDNAPVFTTEVFHGAIEELSAANSLVMVINATDADEENNLNSKLAYRIVSSTPQIFFLSKSTGEIRTVVDNLDREKQSSYTLVVEVRDRDGNAQGLVGTSTVSIDIVDVNDNIPVLEKDMYEGSVDENTADVEVLRMKAFDLDQEGTDNWLANFTIISGNEQGYFRIETDPVTNEGILILVKEVDYEELQNMELNVVVSNKASYHSSITTSSSTGGGGGGGGAAGGGGGGGGGAKSVPIKVKVKNVSEGPMFRPKRKSFSVSENKKSTTKYQIIGSYPATDGDTLQNAKNVRYAKESDPDNWFLVDPNTAEIKLAKIPDRESPYVVNGTYVAKILAISDVLPGKTATGTIEIQVEDVNDNCPQIVNPSQTICDNAPFINITAADPDAYPNGAPFTFTVLDEPAGTASNWAIASTNATSVQLVAKNLRPRSYEVPIAVMDNQGLKCPEKQTLQLTACTCTKDYACQDRMVGDRKTELGAGAIGLMILACLLLLLLPLLLLVCYCGAGAGGKGFTAIPDGPVEMLRSWNNEGTPEDMAVPPHMEVLDNANRVGGGLKAWEDGTMVSNGYHNGTKGTYNHGHSMMERRWEEGHLLQTAAGNTFGAGGAIGGAIGAGAVGGGVMIAGGGSSMKGAGAEESYGAGSYGGGRIEANGNFGGAGALQENFIKEYFSDKALFYTEEDESQPAKDCLLVYSQEGIGSPTGSIGCCSFIEGEMEDSFLDDLGLKFKTLAEICLGQQMYMKIEEESSSIQGANTSMSRPDKSVMFSDSSVVVDNVRQEELSKAGYHSQHFIEPNITQATDIREEIISEETMSSRLNVLPVPRVQGNMLVTEKSYVTAPSVQPVTILHEPRLQQNVIMTERVLAPGSNLHGMLDMHDLSDGQNVLVTERYINGDSGVIGLRDMPDSQYVVVRERERVLAPSSTLQTARNMSELSEGQNVLVTERLFAPVASIQGNRRIPSEVSTVQNIVTEKNIVSGTGMQGHILASEPLLNNTGYTLEEPPSSSRSLGQSSSRVTKYSTVQYSRS
ncbi:desmoglein-2 [Lissotriton helveticus]